MIGLVDGVDGLVDHQVKLYIDIGEVRPSAATYRPPGVPTRGSARGSTWMGWP